MIDGSGGETIWERLEKGEVDEGKVWEAYKKNLALVMKHVEDLNLNGKTIITADHANFLVREGHMVIQKDLITDLF